MLRTEERGYWEVSGHPLVGGYRLVFKLRLKRVREAKEPVEIVDGILEIAGPGSVPKIGVALPCSPNTSSPFGSNWEPAFALDLELPRLEAINTLRGPGGELKLCFAVELLLAGSQGLVRILESGNYDFSGKEVDDALKGAGFGETLVCSVTVRRNHPKPDLQTAFRTLVDAVEHLRKTAGNDAQSRAAVSECRLAFDAGDVDANKHAALPPRGTTDPWTKEERLRTLRWALKLNTHLAHHDPAVAWLKTDARLLTFVTAALLEWEAAQP